MSAPVVVTKTNDAESFRVVREGMCFGRWFAAGDVVVCAEDVRDGDEVMLVARGQGSPRPGRLAGGLLFGASGELCHPSRWRVSGRIVAVHAAHLTLVQTLPEVHQEPTEGQLSLFAA